MKTGLLLFLSIFSFFPAFTQTDILKLSPQHFLKNTLKIEWEHSGGANKSWCFSPSFSYKKSFDEDIIGGGLEIRRKLYLGQEPSELTGFYLAFGLSYGYFNMRYIDYIYTYPYGYYYNYTYTTVEVEERIHRIGGDLEFGYQFTIKKQFYLDLLLGGGFRYAESSQGNNSYYNYGLTDFAYNGIIPKAGIRMGMKLP